MHSRTLCKQLAIGTAAAVTTFALLAQASAAFASFRRPDPNTVTNRQAERVIELTNAVRRKNGCPGLTIDPALTAAAQGHSDDMAGNDYFSHPGRDGSNAGDRTTAAGYRWRAWAENIAAGYDSPREVVAAWMASKTHRGNILNCELRDIGVGYAEATGSTYDTYWTQNFGTAK